jgi:glycogen operon protein
MLLGGDEIGRTQQGNNNAYCQDNEISWVDWELDDDKEALLEFTRAVIALRRDHPVFRRRKFFQGQAIHGSGGKDIGWFTPDGHEMDETHWRGPDISTLGVFLNGEALPDRGPRGQRVVDNSFLLLFNGGTEPALFTLPGDPWAKEYQLVADTGLAYVRPPGADAPSYLAGEELSMTSRSLAVLRRRA